MLVIGAIGGATAAGRAKMGDVNPGAELVAGGDVIAGCAGGTADAFTLFERFEAQLEKHQGNLTRAAVELAKDWRTDRALRRLEALLAVADKTASLIITGNGDVLEPENGIIASPSDSQVYRIPAESDQAEQMKQPAQDQDTTTTTAPQVRAKTRPPVIGFRSGL